MNKQLELLDVTADKNLDNFNITHLFWFSFLEGASHKQIVDVAEQELENNTEVEERSKQTKHTLIASYCFLVNRACCEKGFLRPLKNHDLNCGQPKLLAILEGTID